MQPYNALRIALPRHSPQHPRSPPRPTGFHLLCMPSAPRICLMSGLSRTWIHNTPTHGSLRCQILVGVLRLQLRPTTDAWCAYHSSCHRTSLTTNSNCTSFQLTTVLKPNPQTPANSARRCRRERCQQRTNSPHAQCSHPAEPCRRLPLPRLAPLTRMPCRHRFSVRLSQDSPSTPSPPRPAPPRQPHLHNRLSAPASPDHAMLLQQ